MYIYIFFELGASASLAVITGLPPGSSSISCLFLDKFVNFCKAIGVNGFYPAGVMIFCHLQPKNNDTNDRQ